MPDGTLSGSPATRSFRRASFATGSGPRSSWVRSRGVAADLDGLAEDLVRLKVDLVGRAAINAILCERACPARSWVKRRESCRQCGLR